MTSGPADASRPQRWTRWLWFFLLLGAICIIASIFRFQHLVSEDPNFAGTVPIGILLVFVGIALFFAILMFALLTPYYKFWQRISREFPEARVEIAINTHVLGNQAEAFGFVPTQESRWPKNGFVMVITEEQIAFFARPNRFLFAIPAQQIVELRVGESLDSDYRLTGLTLVGTDGRRMQFGLARSETYGALPYRKARLTQFANWLRDTWSLQSPIVMDKQQ